ncbi:MAG: hypothetical protein H7X99_04660 [Saprospiraceae bacterium]|nr:hypothetical protein [Saprospiraceae bacterium]
MTIQFKFLLVSILLSFIFSGCHTQKNITENTPISNFDLKVKPTIVEVDNLGRLYIVDQKNNIINYKPDLKEQYRYANKRGGNVSTLDVTNPFKIVSFSDDFNQIKILDNTLSEISTLNLSEKFADISACATSNDGNLWVFDPVQFKLIKINNQGTVLLESSNVNDVGLSGVKITDIREKGNYVLLSDRNKGFYFFDNLGQYMYTYETKDIKHFQFDGNNVVYFTSTGLKNYSVKFKERQSLSYPSDMNKPGLMYVLYHAGDLYEVNQSGINVKRKAVK